MLFRSTGYVISFSFLFSLLQWTVLIAFHGMETEGGNKAGSRRYISLSFPREELTITGPAPRRIARPVGAIIGIALFL